MNYPTIPKQTTVFLEENFMFSFNIPRGHYGFV